MDTLPLFDEPPAFPRELLAARLRALARDNIFIGGSSWKYEGWFGQVYSRANYVSRGRYSKRLFEDTCLREYARTFPAVCGDFSFYQFPAPSFWHRLFALVPEEFRFAFKVPEQITCKTFPSHQRYGAQAGRENEFFLNPDLLGEMFLKPLEEYRSQAAVLVFEFGAFPHGSLAGPGEFVARLAPFLAALPGGFRYAVEVRNPEFLGPDYFACLRAHGVAHVYNAWSRMPELREQIALPGSVTADFVVCRALLRRGRPYANAVSMFAPYTEVKDPNPEARESLRLLIERSEENRRMAFLFVNNRLEGNAPATILSVVAE